jgi:hypothetical protein
LSWKKIHIRLFRNNTGLYHPYHEKSQKNVSKSFHCFSFLFSLSKTSPETLSTLASSSGFPFSFTAAPEETLTLSLSVTNRERLAPDVDSATAVAILRSSALQKIRYSPQPLQITPDRIN